MDYEEVNDDISKEEFESLGGQDVNSEPIKDESQNNSNGVTKVILTSVLDFISGLIKVIGILAIVAFVGIFILMFGLPSLFFIFMVSVIGLLIYIALK